MTYINITIYHGGIMHHNPLQHVIPLNNDADVVDFLNVVSDYKYEQVHLYVEHMVDHVVMVEEHFLLEARKDGQHVDGDGDRDGDGHGDGDREGKGERGGSMDELPRVVHEDDTCEGHDVDGEISISRNRGRPRVKARVGRNVTLSKKRTSIKSASKSGQPSNQPTSSRGGTYDNII